MPERADTLEVIGLIIFVPLLYSTSQGDVALVVPELDLAVDPVVAVRLAAIDLPGFRRSQTRRRTVNSQQMLRNRIPTTWAALGKPRASRLKPNTPARMLRKSIPNLRSRSRILSLSHMV